MGDTHMMEDFNYPWANLEGARRLVLALPPSSGGHSHNGTYKRQGSDGKYSHQRGRDSERGTLPQQRVSIDGRLVEMEPVGYYSRCCL